jgi:ATP-dependent protease ClpP protease subunit
MPNWRDILSEVKASGSTHDLIRRKYLKELHEKTGRNVIVYYSGWLQKADLQRKGGVDMGLNDSDKNGFMAVIHGLDRNKGLDLILHTPGGGIAATESLVDYLRSMFGTNIRAIVPQIAMSAGTMIALSCKEIVMGKHSSLGPIDPQIGGLAAHAIIEEFQKAKEDIMANRDLANLWHPILQKYSPTLIGECEKASSWSSEIVKEWLTSNMFNDETEAAAKASKIIAELGRHDVTKSHDRHYSLKRIKDLGINVKELEELDREKDLQDAVLSIHHVCIQTLAETQAFKIIENHDGIAFIQGASSVIIQR